jgi:hypothetical protein
MIRPDEKPEMRPDAPAIGPAAAEEDNLRSETISLKPDEQPLAKTLADISDGLDLPCAITPRDFMLINVNGLGYTARIALHKDAPPGIEPSDELIRIRIDHPQERGIEAIIEEGYSDSVLKFLMGVDAEAAEKVGLIGLKGDALAHLNSMRPHVESFEMELTRAELPGAAPVIRAYLRTREACVFPEARGPAREDMLTLLDARLFNHSSKSDLRAMAAEVQYPLKASDAARVQTGLGDDRSRAILAAVVLNADPASEEYRKACHGLLASTPWKYESPRAIDAERRICLAEEAHNIELQKQADANGGVGLRTLTSIPVLQGPSSFELPIRDPAAIDLIENPIKQQYVDEKTWRYHKHNNSTREIRWLREERTILTGPVADREIAETYRTGIQVLPLGYGLQPEQMALAGLFQGLDKLGDAEKKRLTPPVYLECLKGAAHPDFGRYISFHLYDRTVEKDALPPKEFVAMANQVKSAYEGMGDEVKAALAASPYGHTPPHLANAQSAWFSCFESQLDLIEPVLKYLKERSEKAFQIEKLDRATILEKVSSLRALAGSIENSDTAMSELGVEHRSGLDRCEATAWLACAENRLLPANKRGAILDNCLHALDDLKVLLEDSPDIGPQAVGRALDVIGIAGQSILTSGTPEQLDEYLSEAAETLGVLQYLPDEEEDGVGYTIGIGFHRFSKGLQERQDFASIEKLFGMLPRVELKSSLAYALLDTAMHSGDRDLLGATCDAIEPVIKEVEAMMPHEGNEQRYFLALNAEFEVARGDYYTASEILKGLEFDSNISRLVAFAHGANAALALSSEFAADSTELIRSVDAGLALMEVKDEKKRSQAELSFLSSYLDGLAHGGRLFGGEKIAAFLQNLAEEYPQIETERYVWTKTLALRAAGLQDPSARPNVLVRNVTNNIASSETIDDLVHTSYDMLSVFLDEAFVPDKSTQAAIADAYVAAAGQFTSLKGVGAEITWTATMLAENGFYEQAMKLEPEKFGKDVRKLRWQIRGSSQDADDNDRTLEKSFDTSMLEYLAETDDAIDAARGRLAADEYGYDSRGRELDEMLVSMADSVSNDTGASYAHRALDLVPDLLENGFPVQAATFLKKAETAVNQSEGWNRSNLIRRICETMEQSLATYQLRYGSTPK